MVSYVLILHLFTLFVFLVKKGGLKAKKMVVEEMDVDEASETAQAPSKTDTEDDFLRNISEVEVKKENKAPRPIFEALKEDEIDLGDGMEVEPTSFTVKSAVELQSPSFPLSTSSNLSNNSITISESSIGSSEARLKREEELKAALVAKKIPLVRLTAIPYKTVVDQYLDGKGIYFFNFYSYSECF